jgi:hypothetical protein
VGRFNSKGNEMAESKFTPGPWVAEQVTAGNRTYWSIHTDRQFIGSTADTESFGCEQEANAELMADAPALLKVLREVLTYADICTGWQHIDEAEQAFGDANDLLEKHGG